MTIITDYKIISDSNKAIFQARIIDLINQGWEPIGGICVDKECYYQAMIMKEVQ